MLDTAVYGHYTTAWCPGCGNHDILIAVKKALALRDLPPHKVLMVSGIGQAAKAPHYITANVFNGLHGRGLPAAVGAKLANPELTVLVESGDGCLYGEGGNHFLATLRRNISLTILAHNNGIYGLTKGQASPTSTPALSTRAQPYGVNNLPFNPLATAIIQGASLVARGFSGEKEHLAALISEAIQHPGVALIDILTPCVSFNKHNTFAWYKKRCRPLPSDYDPTDKFAALAQAEKWEEEIPLGVIFRRTDRLPMERHFPALANGPLANQPVDGRELRTFQDGFR